MTKGWVTGSDIQEPLPHLVSLWTLRGKQGGWNYQDVPWVGCFTKVWLRAGLQRPGTYFFVLREGKKGWEAESGGSSVKKQVKG